VPPSLAVPEPPPESDDEPPAPDPLSEEPEVSARDDDADPPLALEEFAGGFDRLGISWLPVTVGGESEYWMPLESA
jgi:hypothetical protein